ncbi:hypothetical protein ACLB2K_010532 [Fragaria x ananassa]
MFKKSQKKYSKGESSSNNHAGDSSNKNTGKGNNQTQKSDSNCHQPLYIIPGGIPDMLDLYRDHHNHNVPNRRSNNSENRRSAKEEEVQPPYNIPGPIPDMTSLYRDGLSDSLYTGRGY